MGHRASGVTIAGFFSVFLSDPATARASPPPHPSQQGGTTWVCKTTHTVEEDSKGTITITDRRECEPLYNGVPFDILLDEPPSGGGAGGGAPPPKDPPDCGKCYIEYEKCYGRARQMQRKCESAMETHARMTCSETQRNRFGEYVTIEKKSCFDVFTLDVRTGRRTRIGKRCYGYHVDWCIKSYMTDAPDRGSETTHSVSIAGLENGKTSTVTWGGGKGFKSACNDYTTQLITECLTEQLACEQECVE